MHMVAYTIQHGIDLTMKNYHHMQVALCAMPSYSMSTSSDVNCGNMDYCEPIKEHTIIFLFYLQNCAIEMDMHEKIDL